MALTVCRLCLQPGAEAGRLRHASRVGIAVRAALFVELIFQGRVTGSRWPQALGYAAGSGTGGLTDSLHRAVAGRPQVRWRRWYSHVEPDVAAAQAALVAAGVWSPASAAGSRAIRDLDPALTKRQADQARDLLLTAQSGRPLNRASAEEIAVVLLSVGAGLQGTRPRPRAALRALDRLLPADEATPRLQSALLPERGNRGGPSERTVLRAALRGALEAMRARAGSRLLSG